MFRPAAVLTFLLVGLCIPVTSDAQAPSSQPPKPAPDIANEQYGPHERNVLDLWKAKSEKPTPLVVFIHGGGFYAGSKEIIFPTLFTLLDKGISVMAINYRLSPEVTFPAHYMDAARAIQYARLHSREWNLDPKRIGATGSSAGAGISLWLGFHDDMADPGNADPVLRESTRFSCIGVLFAQTTYDPIVITEWIGEAAARHPALERFYGLTWDQLHAPAARETFKMAAPITYISKGDPPVHVVYNEPRGPLPAGAPPGRGIHHITFGIKLKEQMDKLGIECTIRHVDENVDPYQETNDFLVKHLLGGKAGR